MYQLYWTAFRSLLGKEINRFMRIWVQTLVPPAITMTPRRRTNEQEGKNKDEQQQEIKARMNKTEKKCTTEGNNRKQMNKKGKTTRMEYRGKSKQG